MAPRWQPGVIAVTLCDVRDGPAIDLEIESEIPSEIRHSVHGQVTRRKVTRPEVTRGGTSLRNSADENCAQKNQKNLAGEAVFGFHDTYYAHDWFFASTDAEQLSPLLEISRLFVRFDHSARFIENPNHCMHVVSDYGISRSQSRC
jgi:hypothetical protein